MAGTICKKTHSLSNIIVILITALISIINGTITTVDSAPTVTIPGLGSVFGETVRFTTNEHPLTDSYVDVYRGIRYGEPPVGMGRFAKPVASGPWSGDYNATYFRSYCPQTESDEENLKLMSEDCLFVNVWTPNPKPLNATVMLWIYGGGFLFGQGSEFDCNGVPLVSFNKDIVYVTFNYRVNSFGFLATGDSDLPGNYGLWDQNLALKWTKEHIAAFGGNPENIVLFGQSAGGAGVNMHLLSPHGQDFFNRVILQSGNVMMPWAVEYDREKYTRDAYEMGRLAGCDGQYENTRDFVACMRDLPWQNITSASNKLIGQVKNVLPFVPIVDGDFLPDKPINLLSLGKFKQCDILIGSTKDDGSLIAIRAFIDQVPRRNPKIGRDRFEDSLAEYVYSYNNDVILDAVAHAYIDWTEADNPDANYFYNFIDMQTDEAFKCPAETVARAHMNYGNNVYLYHMTYKPTSSFWGETPSWLGVAHADDLQFVFGWHFIPEMEWEMTALEINMSLDVMKYWTNFAKTGNPNTERYDDETEDAETLWKPYEAPSLQYKELHPVMTNAQGLKADECQFWNNLVPRMVTFTADLETTEMEYREDTDQWRHNHMPLWKDEFNKYKTTL